MDHQNKECIEGLRDTLCTECSEALSYLMSLDDSELEGYTVD